MDPALDEQFQAGRVLGKWLYDIDFFICKVSQMMIESNSIDIVILQ